MGNYRYPPSLNQTRNEDGDETWEVVETMHDGEIIVHDFTDREEALKLIDQLATADNPQEEVPAETVEAVADDPATEGVPDGS